MNELVSKPARRRNALPARVAAVMSRRYAPRALMHGFTALGACWMVLEFTNWAFVSIDPHRTTLLIVAIVLSTFWGVARSVPRTSYRRRFPSKSVRIALQVGDILSTDRTENIGVLSSDYFDSCVDTAISERSIKAQLVQRYFSGQKTEFDAAVDRSLAKQGIAGTPNPAKEVGPNRTIAYDAGTTAAVPLGANRSAFVVVAATMDITTTKTTTNAARLWKSLLALWDAVDRFGHRKPVAVPLWGANLGCAPGNRSVLLSTMLCSFAAWAAEKNQPPTSDLTIIVWSGDYDPEEFEDFVRHVESFEL